MIILIYLAKMIACSFILYGYYLLALRNSRYHMHNRAYLLAVPLLSILLPLVKISFSGATYAESINPIKLLGSWEEEVVIYAGGMQSENFISIQNILLIIYIVIAIIVITPFVRSWLAIRALKKSCNHTIHNGVTVYYTKTAVAPFSFLNAIFWNENLSLKTESSEKIFRHEYYHIRQKHSLDLLYLITVQSIFWINPINYFLRKELESIHEFMADKYAVSNGDKYNYAELLVANAINYRNLLTHQFFNNQIKRRITMITRNKINRMDSICRIAVLPFLLIVFSAFCLRLEAQESVRKGADTLTIAELKKIEGSDVKSISIDDNSVRLLMKNNQEFVTNRKTLEDFMGLLQTEEDKQSGKKTAEKTWVKTEIEASFPGGSSAWGRFLQDNVKYPMEAQKKDIEGTVVLQFVVPVDGNVEDIRVLSGPMEGGLREHAVEVIRSSGKWLPAIQDGKPVRAYKKQPITFKLR